MIRAWGLLHWNSFTAPVSVMALSVSNLSKYSFSQASISTVFSAAIFLTADRELAEEAARSTAVRHASDNLESVEAGSAKACALAASVTVVTQAKSMILRTAGIL